MKTVATGLFGALYVLLGVWAGIDSSSFTRALADFGPENDHLVHDFAAASLAVGAGLLIALPRAAWRTPVLLVATLWTGLHAVSHAVDLGNAASRAVGITELVLLAGGTVLLGVLAVLSKEDG